MGNDFHIGGKMTSTLGWAGKWQNDQGELVGGKLARRWGGKQPATVRLWEGGWPRPSVTHDECKAWGCQSPSDLLRGKFLFSESGWRYLACACMAKKQLYRNMSGSKYRIRPLGCFFLIRMRRCSVEDLVKWLNLVWKRVYGLKLSAQKFLEFVKDPWKWCCFVVFLTAFYERKMTLVLFSLDLVGKYTYGSVEKTC